MLCTLLVCAQHAPVFTVQALITSDGLYNNWCMVPGSCLIFCYALQYSIPMTPLQHSSPALQFTECRYPWICMVLEWTPEEASLLQDQPFCCSVSLHLKRSMGDSDIFQHQSTGYLMTRRQETLYETCACVIHTNLQLHYYSTMRHSTIDLSLFNTSEESLRD